MKKLYIIIFALAINHISGFTQGNNKNITGKVSYLSILRNSLFIPGSANKVDTTDLFFNDTSSVYIIRQSLNSMDKIMKNMSGFSREVQMQIEQQLKTRMTKMKQKYSFHKAGSNSFSYPWDTPSGDKSFCVIDTVPEFEWELMPDTTTILGFLCQKAVCKSKVIGNIEREYIAWYTPDIPVSYGPLHFFGLPGMILQIENKYYSYKAISIQLPISQEGITAIRCCTELPLISKKVVSEITEKQRNDVLNMQKLGKN